MEVAAGRSRVLVLRGEAGIGKSALVEYLVQRASEFQVARAVGVERVEAQGGRALITFAPSTKVTPERLLAVIGRSRGRMKMLREFTMEAQIPRGEWPAVRAALTALLTELGK